MLAYATTVGRSPEFTYRQIDLAGRTASGDPHALVGVLYEELIRSLGAIAVAVAQGNGVIKSEKISRAIAILFALESGLDFNLGGDLAITLAGLYRGARRKIIDASLENTPGPFLEVARNMNEIASAWRELKQA